MPTNKTSQGKNPETYPVRASWITDQGWCVWLNRDPRSVAAMLRGRGDGREKLYDEYAREWRERNPGLLEEDLHTGYADYAIYMDRKMDKEMAQERQQAKHANRFAFLIARTSARMPSKMDILVRVDQHRIGIAFVVVLAFIAAHYF